MNKKLNRFNIVVPQVTERLSIRDEEFEKLGLQLKKSVDAVFGRSLAIRELDAGSDNATEIEMVNLTTAHYDIERFGVTFVASPRHADILAVTGAVTHNMEIAVKKTYDAMPAPKFVIAVGNEACDGGIFKNTYGVRNGVETVIPVDFKIPGNPPSPLQIMTGLLGLMRLIRACKVS
ncbi:MAG TPA: NADH-quinone oxidoreductase subunit NuoB [Dehalococcoidales bacterium]|nr:NADH-quinone oxidoreductase subunit NuoB [Dehalococcoidales bacterium]